MRKLVLVVHISLDGFVAGPDGELTGFEAGEENLEFVCKLTETADAALFGRKSYQLLDVYWPTAKDLPNATRGQSDYSNWYNRAKKIVVSNTITAKDASTIVINDHITDQVAKIKKQAGKDILIFGSPSVARPLMHDGLIDDYWIFINPAIFGKGIPLFDGKSNRIKLRLVDTRPFQNGELALHYTL